MERIVPGIVNTGSETGTLVEVTFQKSPYQNQKYLEGEPKILGVTQIMLSIFFLSALGVNWNHEFSGHLIVSVIFTSASTIAGSLAIAAQNLHLPTLKACLGMQVVACVFSVVCFMISWGLMVEFSFMYYCWDTYHNETSQISICDRLSAIYNHITGIQMLVLMTQIALSATLAAFCCKVIQCCSPRANVPVVVVNAPPAPVTAVTNPFN